MEAPTALPNPSAQRARSSALRFVLFIGIVSMFSDMTHEGSSENRFLRQAAGTIGVIVTA
jgi:hypothetical protein